MMMMMHSQSLSSQVYMAEGKKYSKDGKVKFDMAIYDEDYCED